MQIYRKYLVNCIIIHIFAKEKTYIYTLMVEELPKTNTKTFKYDSRRTAFIGEQGG